MKTRYTKVHNSHSVLSHSIRYMISST